MDCKRKNSGAIPREVDDCKVWTECANGTKDIRKFSCASGCNRLKEQKITGTLRQTVLSFKRKNEGCVISSSLEPPVKKSASCVSQVVFTPTAETLPPTTENEAPPCAHAKLDYTHSAGLKNDLSIQETDKALVTECSSKESSHKVILHCPSQICILSSMTHAIEAPAKPLPQSSPVKGAQETSHNLEPGALSPSLSSSTRDWVVQSQNQALSADEGANFNVVSRNVVNGSPSVAADQLSSRSWFQGCGVQRLSSVATTASISGTSENESCAKGTMMGTSGTNENQVMAVNLHTAVHNESIHMNTQMGYANPLLSQSELKLETTGMIAGGSYRVAKLFDCLGPMQAEAPGMVTMGFSLGGFSFQRLISGDITGFEHEFAEDSDEDFGEKVRVETEGDESDMYSTVCTSSALPLDQDLELGASSSNSESQHSDDMYSSQIKTAKHSLLMRSMSVDVDSAVSELQPGVEEGASFSSPQKFRGSLCLQPKVEGDWKRTSSDSSGDLYCEDFTDGTKKQTQLGSPCLESTTEVYRPLLPWDAFPEECTPLRSEQQVHGSPCLHPVSDLGWQSSSDISEDLLLCPTSHDISSRISRSKEERAVSSRKTVKEQTNCVEESRMIEAPLTAKALLSSGLLEGHLVSYNAKGSGVLLTGTVKNGGILCNCRLCNGKTVVNVSCFEKHAGSTLRHPSDNIYLENGKSLLDILRAGWPSSDGKFMLATCNALKNNCGEFVNKDHKIMNPAAQSHQKHRSDSNASRGRQALPLSQKRDMNKLLFLPGGLPDGTEVAYYMKGQRLLAGVKKGHGICCNCCNEVISCSLFEAHAGWGSRRNPYDSIFLSDGQSLHKFAQSLAVKIEKNGALPTSGDNDDICTECGDGGDLVLCDACPGAYHTECLGLSSIPEGDWFCPLCEDKVQSARDTRSQSFGSLSRMATTKKGLERCQRVVKASKNSIGGCVICQNGDFLKTGFGAKTVLLCDQCEREFHVGCMKDKGIEDLQELPSGEWFCGADCCRIHKFLEELVSRGPMPVCNSIYKVVLESKQLEEGQLGLKPQMSEFTWQLLHGRRGDPENGKILSEAAAVFTESFDPIIDASSNRDLISLMVHSRSIRDQDFRGMYCAVLKWKQVIVSTAMIRVFGKRFAEMPLVATNTAYRGQGFFQILMFNVEHLLGMLQVEHLVLPATDEAEGIWIKKFGFSKLEEEQVQQFESEVQIMMFQGSSMLLKSIPCQPFHE